jgi:membrane protein
MSGKGVITVIKAAVAGYGTDRVPLLAAALAFFAMFAMAPLLIIVIEIGAAFLGGSGHHMQIRDAILNRLQPAIGKQGALAIAAIVQATFNKQSEGVLPKIASWVFFIVAATGFFGSVQGALDQIWVAAAPTGFLQTILIRLKSFAIIAGAAIVIVAMAVTTTALGGIGGHLLSQIASPILMLIVATLLFAVLYKWLPKTRIGWRDVIGGSAVTALLTVVGQYAIGLYLGRASTTSTYGAAGSLAAILLWLYYSATIFLIGAELIKAYATTQQHTPPTPAS